MKVQLTDTQGKKVEAIYLQTIVVNNKVMAIVKVGNELMGVEPVDLFFVD